MNPLLDGFSWGVGVAFGITLGFCLCASGVGFILLVIKKGIRRWESS